MLYHKVTKEEIESERIEITVCKNTAYGMAKKLSYLRHGDKMWWKVTASGNKRKQSHLYNRIESATRRYNGIAEA